MKSVNFTFLQKDYPDLAELGGFAEQYAGSDPASAVVKLRVFGEQLTKIVYQRYQLPLPHSRDFSSLLTAHDFQNTVSKVICDKLHALRKNGNAGAHGRKVQRQTALWLLKEAYQVGAWLGVQFLGLSFEQLPSFTNPQPADNPEKLRKELDQQFERLSNLIEEHDRLKSDYEAISRKKDEQAKLYQQSQTISETLGFSEEKTRKHLIDTALADVGWQLDDKNEVTLEEEVDGQPTKSGKGFADYVLWGNDGKPLAVIEAKKTAKDASAGRQQAKLYADSLEERYEQRPVIFYTNGHEINMWDDAGGYGPRKLFGFYSKNSLEYLIFQRREKKTR